MITERRIIDRVIHNRRSEISKYDQELRTLKLTDCRDASWEETRTALINLRSKLSAEQGFDKAYARRSDKCNRLSIQMRGGIAIRTT